VNLLALGMTTQIDHFLTTGADLARVVCVQYQGDYREAVVRLANGGQENYYAQEYSVNFIAEIAQRVDSMTVICCMSTEVYDELLHNGVRAIGAGFRDRIDTEQLITLLKAQRPTHLVLRTPILQVIQWAIRQNIKILLTLADSFSTQGLKNKVKNLLLANALNHHQVDWVGNHGLNASLSLKQIGVKPKKIVPWDWPSVVAPASFEPKPFPGREGSWNLVYAGAVVESKGVGDVIAAIANLKDTNHQVHLKVAGEGKLEQFIHQAQQLNVADKVEFLGMVAHQNVIQLLQEADIVVVPSRHEYPEGFPMTIYETLCTRTPIITSDHPMFQNILQHQQNAMIFSAGDGKDLASCIRTIMSNPVLYEKISMAASDTWNTLQIPVKWANLINTWLFNSPENQQWLTENSLLSYLNRN